MRILIIEDEYYYYHEWDSDGLKICQASYRLCEKTFKTTLDQLKLISSALDFNK